MQYGFSCSFAHVLHAQLGAIINVTGVQGTVYSQSSSFLTPISAYAAQFVLVEKTRPPWCAFCVTIT